MVPETILRSQCRMFTIIALALTAPGLCLAQTDAPLFEEENAPPATGVSRADATLLFGPIDGFTTIAHEAPEQLAVPFYSTVELVLDVEYLRDQDVILWEGEGEVSADGRSMTCKFQKFEPMEISVWVAPNGMPMTCTLYPVVAFSNQLRLDYDVSLTEPFELGSAATFKETMDAFHLPSIARLTATSTGFVTSIDQSLQLACVIDTRWPRFHSIDADAIGALMEWRVDGEIIGIGRQSLIFDEPGVHQIEVGPPDNRSRFEITAYDVSFESDFDGQPLPQNTPITFFATTDPAGFENQVQWLVSTKYGRAEPTTGVGAIFTTTLIDTFGLTEDGELHEWLGVKADNVDRGQDQKVVCASIDSVLPLSGGTSDVITITGSGFDPPNSCVFFGGIAAGRVLPGSDATTLFCEIGPVTSLGGDGSVVVVAGSRTPIADQTITAMSGGTTIEGDMVNAGILADGDACAFASVGFQVVGNLAANASTAAIVNDKLEITINGTWNQGDTAVVEIHLLCSVSGKYLEMNNDKPMELMNIRTSPVINPIPNGAIAALVAALINAVGAGDGVTASAAGDKVTVCKVGGIADTTNSTGVTKK